ncbi:hypothetical protein K9U39_11870 [Rhodoblastus acidophilus]|uniref:Uncharacterized protein n=1 Tax=Candidatus Rhodoblastus alkanivorans TaxID=2954117 RepID=A0ABS9ZA53_9HYPH|nr:hypothetical protein [Candidatus Rhodoblastus alkanivorans]MCI4679774.1 hypothetical protein [Candidatus Rhodoblastus alkanivorans]MCI4684306.1 hypothetical protein [Candidatus Rhodoblastus alkanivorans]MDI4641627.1 hypothetical protein [Rhodoblastus acidophilus]
MLNNRENPLSPTPAVVGAAFLLLGAGHAMAGGYGHGSSLPFLDPVVEWIGFDGLSGDRRNLFGYAVIGFALAFGYFTNLALKERGLGAIVNGVVGVGGIALALHLVLPRLSLLNDASDKMRFNLAMIAAGAGAAFALVVAAVAKSMVSRLLTRGFIVIGRPPRPAPIQTEPKVEPRIAAALRKKD